MLMSHRQWDEICRTVWHWIAENTGCLSEQHFTALNVVLTNYQLLLFHKEQLFFFPLGFVAIF